MSSIAIVHGRNGVTMAMVVLVLVLLALVNPTTAGSLLFRKGQAAAQAAAPAAAPRSRARLLAGRNSTLAIGSSLHSGDQCGGAGGLCNSTTIGIPCGDHAWDGVYCPNNFACQRQNVSFWQCKLIPGKRAAADATWSGSYDITPNSSSSGSTLSRPWGWRLPGANRAVADPGPNASSGSNSSTDRHQSGQQADPNGPIVPVCGPGTLPEHNAMCNRTSKFILPLDVMANPSETSAVGRGRGSKGGLAWLAAVLLATAAIAQHAWLGL